LPGDNLTVRDVYKLWIKELPRPSAGADRQDLCSKLRERLGWPSELPKVTAKRLGTDKSSALECEFWWIETEPGIRLPAVYLHSGEAKGSITLVPGRDREAIAKALAAGRAVLVIDLRGMGELADPTAKASRWPKMVGTLRPQRLSGVQPSIFNWAWLAGRPWPGQWALDLAQAARFARTQLGATTVTIAAQDEYAWATLLAGAAAPELVACPGVRLPRASFIDDIRERGDQSLADVPGLLEIVDIEQLRQLCSDGQAAGK
jgi:hypothetical protein